MPRITEHNAKYVTLGVVDRNLELYPDLQSVTFTDHNGTPHTVYAHKEGPFTDPDHIVGAWEDGVLHVHQSHADAAAYERNRGNHDTAERLEALAGEQAPTREQDQGGGY